MPLTLLGEKPALLLIDLQVGTLAAGLAHPAADIVAHAAALATAFRRRSLPVIVATVTGTPPGRTHHGPGGRDFPAEFSEIAPGLDVRPDDIVLARAAWSAFGGTDLDERLRAAGATHVVIGGVATSFGVESTARGAYDLGYDVVIAIDAVTDRSMDAHDGSMTRVFPALGQLATTSEILALSE